MEFPLMGMLFVLGIIAISKYTSLQKHKLNVSLQRSEADRDELLHELDTIKQRLQVLERIVTDKNYSLHEEFERLKNRP